MSLHERAAKALGWSVKDTQSMSMHSLRELVRPVDPDLAREMDYMIRSGAYVAEKPQQLAAWRSKETIRAATKKGDRLDNFGQIWRVLRVTRNKITAARELADPRDREKVVLADQRDFHPRDIAHMRKVG